MNIERLHHLADFIETLKNHYDPLEDTEPTLSPDIISTAPTEFDISQWRCNTCACIAGSAAHLAMKEGHDPILEDDEVAVPLTAQRWLELDPDTSSRLFLPSIDWSDVTPERAASAIRRLATTGRVTW